MLNKTYIALQMRYLDAKADSEKGATSLEYAIIAGVIITIAVAIGLKIGLLQDDAEAKIPDSL